MTLPVDSLHFLYGPGIALIAVLLLGALLRWTFGDSRAMPGPNRGEGHGLLVEVGVVPSAEAATVLRRRLAEAGIKATVSGAGGGGGYQLLVFPADEADARTVLSKGALG